MKLKKFFLLIILVSLTNFLIYSQDIKSLLKQASVNLQKTTLLLQEQQKVNFSLNKKNKSLEIENLKLKKELQKIDIILSDNNNLLLELKNRISKDQIEIKNLRDKLKIAINNIEKQSYFNVGIGLTYPQGINIFTSFFIPNIPIFIYGNINGYSNIKFLFSIGIGIKL